MAMLWTVVQAFKEKEHQDIYCCSLNLQVLAAGDLRLPNCFRYCFMKWLKEKGWLWWYKMIIKTVVKRNLFTSAMLVRLFQCCHRSACGDILKHIVLDGVRDEPWFPVIYKDWKNILSQRLKNAPLAEESIRDYYFEQGVGDRSSAAMQWIHCCS